MFRALKERLNRVKTEAADLVDRDERTRDRKIEEVLWQLEIALLEADVALSVVEEIKRDLKNTLTKTRFQRRRDVEAKVEEALRESIKRVLTSVKGSFVRSVQEGDRPFVIMFVGVNGSGKTTVIAKVAHRLMKRNMTCVIAASDTFRAGAIEQLERHAQKLGVRLIKQRPGSDPAAVAYDAIQHARAKGKDVVLIDTAGRMQTNVNLMDEMAKIKRVASPHLIIFVGDALTGNDAVEQARKFDEAVGIDGVILTKVDADAKGGAALSIAHTIGKPIFYLSTGQEYEDIIPFSPSWFLEQILT